jgi:DNA-binding response OmpR family regulator
MALCESCGAALRGPKLPAADFDAARHQVIVAGSRRKVAPTAWRILELLGQRSGRHVSRESLMAALYEHRNDPPFERVLDIYICHLRKTLRGSPYRIITAYTLGWRLAGPGDHDMK